MAEWQAAMHLPQTECMGLEDLSMLPTECQQQPQLENTWENATSPPWTTDLLSGFDPSSFFDGYLDWSSVAMNVTPPMER